MEVLWYFVDQLHSQQKTVHLFILFKNENSKSIMVGDKHVPIRPDVHCTLR